MKVVIVKSSEVFADPTIRMDAKYWIDKKKTKEKKAKCLKQKEQQENWTNKSLKTIVAKLDQLDKQKEH